MRKLIAGFILIVTLPLMGSAQEPEVAPGSSPEAMPPGSAPPQTSGEKGAGSVDEQSNAYNICLRATQRFREQEKAKGNREAKITPLSASCKDELKPASYWLCMDKESLGEVDFNTAHWRCAKQTNILK